MANNVSKAKTDLEKTLEKIPECDSRVACILTAGDLKKLETLDKALSDVLSDRTLLDHLTAVEGVAVPNPVYRFDDDITEGEYAGLDEDDVRSIWNYVSRASDFWKDKPEITTGPVEMTVAIHEMLDVSTAIRCVKDVEKAADIVDRLNDYVGALEVCCDDDDDEDESLDIGIDPDDSEAVVVNVKFHGMDDSDSETVAKAVREAVKQLSGLADTLEHEDDDDRDAAEWPFLD